VQAITPALAAGLHLARTVGVIISDVAPDGPAANAGVQVQDILTMIEGKPIDNVPALALEFYAHKAGDTVTLGLLRGTQPVTVTVSFVERPRGVERLKDVTDPERNAIPKLGIVGVDITQATSDQLPELRIRSGVFVVAREQESPVAVPLVTGDVVHAVNGMVIASVDQLRAFLDGLKANAEIVLQIERDGRLMFVTIQF
jgi:serine protease Do